MGKDSDKRGPFGRGQQNQQGMNPESENPSSTGSSLPFLNEQGKSPVGADISASLHQEPVVDQANTNLETHIQEDTMGPENPENKDTTAAGKAAEMKVVDKNKVTFGQVMKRVAMIGGPFLLGVAGATLFYKFGPKINIGKAAVDTPAKSGGK